MQKRFRRKIAAVSVFLLLFLTGCHETADTPIVALKQNARAENKIAWNKNLTIEEQVQAPETYQDTFYGNNGNLEVKIDADVILPDAEGFKIKNVAPRDFTSEDVEQIKQALTKQGYTAENEDQGQGTNEIYLEKDGDRYVLAIWNQENYLEKDSFLYFYKDQIEMETGQKDITKKKLRKEGRTLLKEMALTDFVLGGEEVSISVDSESDLSGAIEGGEGESYILFYTRKVDGISITYTSQSPDLSVLDREDYGIAETDDGNNANKIQAKFWDEENVRILFSKWHGIDFLWKHPYSITDGSDEYVFLLPFSEIHQIFESVITANYGEPEIKTAISVNQIRLGYMRVLDKENLQTSKLVPVWDFFGSIQRSISYKDGDTGYIDVQGDPYYSMVTINAMDGTIIDRNLGY